MLFCLAHYTTVQLAALPQALFVESPAALTTRTAACIANTTVEKSLTTTKETNVDDLDLFNAPAVAEPTASPVMHLDKPRFAWIPSVGVEVRPVNELSFTAASTSRDIAEGSLIRFFRRTFLGNLATPSTILLPQNGTSLTFFPGAVFRLSQHRIDPKLGRYQLVLPQIADFEILFPSGAVFNLTSGEAFFELDAQGEVTVAVTRGSGWLKDVGRKTLKLSAGKQIRINRTGVLTQIREVDSRWKTTPYQGFAPVPDVTKARLARKATNDGNDREQNEEDSQENDDLTDLAADVTGDVRKQITSTVCELQEPSVQYTYSLLATIASPPATFHTAMAPAARMSKKAPFPSPVNDNLPKVSDSLLSYMSPETRALLTRNPASASLSTTVASATGALLEKAPHSRNQSQDLLKLLERRVLERQQPALPVGSSHQAVHNRLEQLPAATLPIRTMAWEYLTLPGFPPIPLPSLRLPAHLPPDQDSYK